MGRIYAGGTSQTIFHRQGMELLDMDFDCPLATFKGDTVYPGRDTSAYPFCTVKKEGNGYYLYPGWDQSGYWIGWIDGDGRHLFDGPGGRRLAEAADYPDVGGLAMVCGYLDSKPFATRNTNNSYSDNTCEEVAAAGSIPIGGDCGYIDMRGGPVTFNPYNPGEFDKIIMREKIRAIKTRHGIVINFFEKIIFSFFILLAAVGFMVCSCVLSGSIILAVILSPIPLCVIGGMLFGMLLSWDAMGEDFKTRKYWLERIKTWAPCD